MNTVPNPKHPPAAPRRIWRVVLVVSLALNLIVVGIAVGGALRWHAVGGPRDVPMGEVRAMWRMLPPDARAALRAEATQEHGVRAERGAARAQRQVMIELLTASQFDANAFAQALDAQGRLVLQNRAALAQSFANQVARLTPDERAEMAQALQSYDHRARPRP